MSIAVREYTPETAAQIIADAKARRAMFYAPPPPPTREQIVRKGIGIRRMAQPHDYPRPPMSIRNAIVIRDWLDTAEPAAVQPAHWRKALDIVSRYTGVTVLDIKSERRQKKLVEARQIAFYVLRSVTTYSFPRIGEICGGRDHSTVLHGCAKVERRLANDPAYALFVGAIVNELQGEMQ
jgi:hypothetical protein